MWRRDRRLLEPQDLLAALPRRASPPQQKGRLMPPTQHGQPYRLGPNRWGLRYYDVDGIRRRKSPFATKSAALEHYRRVIEPQLRGEPAPMPELTLAELVDVYLQRHAANVRAGTIDTLRDRLARALAAFGDVPLRELERMAGDIAAWQARLPDRSRHDYVRALRQVLDAGARWGHIAVNPAALAGRNPQPPARAIRVYGRAELDAVALELPVAYHGLPAFAAATGLRPQEWAALERGDVDRRAGVVNVRRTVTGGKRKRTPLRIVELAKTSASRRQVPLSPRALDALDAVLPRLDTPLLWPADGADRCGSTTGAGACGRRPSRPPASRARRASTTRAARSRRTRSRPASTSSSSPASWVRASR
jgi:integrase